jgi:SM-20-related protein
MGDSKPAAWPDLFVAEQFLDPGTCRQIVAEMSAAQGDEATVYGRTTSGSVDQSVRQTLRIRPSTAMVESVVHCLLGVKHVVEQHFAVGLSECEDPQFLRYREGDFFVAHQDGNTRLTRLNTERRLVSTVMFLSQESDSPQPDTHCGGSLLFTDLRTAEKFRVVGEPGMLIAFRAETTHEITPVTHGERYSIVSWYR